MAAPVAQFDLESAKERAGAMIAEIERAGRWANNMIRTRSEPPHRAGRLEAILAWGMNIHSR